MRNVQDLLESERAAERQFASEMAGVRPVPGGWSPALLLYHVSVWRDVLLGSLRELNEGRTVTPPPARERVDEFNAQHLMGGKEVELNEALERSDRRLADMIGLWTALGDRPFTWYVTRTVGEAMLRNSYYHPRTHIAEHYTEKGDHARAVTIYEETAAGLQQAAAPAYILDPALENLRRARAWSPSNLG